MKKILTTTLVVSCLSFNFYKAQEVIKKDTIQGTELTISMDSPIASAITKAENSCKINLGKSSSSKTTTKTTPTANKEKSLSEICKQNPRIMGYKIQVAVAKSNAEANKIKADFRKSFPSIKAETDASLRPNFKILAGSFFTKESANVELRKIKKVFGSAVAVQYYIFCVEGK